MIRLTALLRYVVLIDYRLQYSRRMGTIGPGEAYDHHVPNAKRISDPSRRWDSMNVTKVFQVGSMRCISFALALSESHVFVVLQLT